MPGEPFHTSPPLPYSGGLPVVSLLGRDRMHTAKRWICFSPRVFLPTNPNQERQVTSIIPRRGYASLTMRDSNPQSET